MRWLGNCAARGGQAVRLPQQCSWSKRPLGQEQRPTRFLPPWVDGGLIVVFLADRDTMKSPEQGLLALSTLWEDVSGLDPVYYQELIESPEPREFRAVPAAVHGVQVDLALGNVDFAEYAAAASAEPDQVLRPI